MQINLAEFFISVMVMLVSARVSGELFQRLKQPALVGELLAGMIIGPSIFNLVQPTESLRTITELAVFFLMFLTGLELHPREIIKAGKNAIILSLTAFFVPFVAGSLASSYMGLNLVASLFVGLTLAITAVAVSSIVLMEFGLLNSKLGTTVVTAGIINDVLSLIVLGVVVQISQSGGGELNYSQIVFSILNIAIFLAAIFIADFLLRRTAHWFPARVTPFFKKMLQTRESAFGIMLIIAIGLSLIAERVGLHLVIGTFFSGLLINRELVGRENFERVSDVFSAVTFGLLSPIFFASIGVEFNAQSVLGSIPLFIILLIVAITGKIGGSYIAAKLAGFSKSASKTIAYLMNSRGMVELVIASIGLELGLIDITVFSIVVAVGFITTVMAPVMARYSLGSTEATQA